MAPLHNANLILFAQEIVEANDRIDTVAPHYWNVVESIGGQRSFVDFPRKFVNVMSKMI